MFDAAANRQPRRWAYAAANSDDGVPKPERALILAPRRGSETKEVLAREIGTLPVDIRERCAIRETRHRQPRVDHPVPDQRSESERTEVGVSAEQSGVAVGGTEGEATSR